MTESRILGGAADHGRPAGAVREVRARAESEARLEEALEFGRTILASLLDRIVILDRRGAIIAVNDAWERFALENGGAEVLARAGVGINYLEVCERAGAREALEGIQSVLSGRSSLYRSEYAIDTPREACWYQLEVIPLRRAEGGAVVMHRDTTAGRKAEEELRRLRRDTWHARRVTQVGAITASLAHELNQPLTAILSNAQAAARILAMPDPDLQEIQAILADIVHDDKRAAEVIVGLRSMLRRQETQRERIDLAKTIQEVLALARNEALAHDIEVELRVPADCPLTADRGQIQQVILNLVTNAIEAMEGQPPERRRLEISLTTTPDEARLAVRDRGPGISPDEQTKVFDSFWTTKSTGMGIGLPISRSIIESHGGRLWFTNNQDQGATFFVALPLEIPRDPA